MLISDVAIDRRTTVFVLLALLVIMGVYSYLALPRESEPEVVIPYISVIVTYAGVAPEDMETLVTIPIEKKLASLSGVDEMVSSSMEGAVSFLIKFETDVDIDVAMQKVRDKIDLAEADLPTEADEPIISQFNTAEMPIMFVNLTGSLGLGELSRIARDLEDRIELVAGVLEVDITGDVEREIQVIVDPIRMGLYGLSLANLVQAAMTENVNTPAGAVDVGEAKYSMRVPGEFRRPDELDALVVKRGDKGVVYLRDLAVVRDGFKEADSLSRLNGAPSLTLAVKKRAGSSIVDVAGAVRTVVEEFQRKLPPSITASVTIDESLRIQGMVEQLESSILTGLVLVLITIFVFLGFSNAFFVAMAIPISLLITFSVMYIAGLTLNMVTLFSLMVSLGMLVDNGIVVVENIYRHAQAGRDPIEAAKMGTREVAMPIFASTLTTIAAFFPMVFWPGLIGSFMNLLPKTVSIALAASLFVGLVVNPALASVFVKVRGGRGEGAAKPTTHPILESYGKVLHTALRWRTVTMVFAVTTLVVIVSIFFSPFRYEFLPKTEPDQAHIDIECAEGTNLASTNEIVKTIEAIVAPYSGEVDFVIANVGTIGAGVRQDPRDVGATGLTSHLGRVTLDFPPVGNAEVMPSTILRELREAFAGLLGAEWSISEMSVGAIGGEAVNIEINGDDFSVLAALAHEVKTRIKDVPGLVDLKDDLVKGKPEVRVIVDREKARLANLSTQVIGLTVQAAIHGHTAAEFRDGDDEYDVVVRFPEAFKADLSNIAAMSITNFNGVPIPFSSVATLEQGAGLGTIKRRDRKRTVTVLAGAEGRSPPEVLADVQAILNLMEFPEGYALAYSGENEDVAETGAFLGGAFVVALFLIALVLITQFNSIIQPLVIMSSVIMSLGGVFLGLLIFDMPFSMLMSGIGCISLSGVVVNNAIVLVDFINQLRHEGMELEEAIVTAAKTRFRPVLLTAVTTILGLIPLAVGISYDFRNLQWRVGGEMSSYWGGMAIAIIFGLTFATVLTLVVVPTLYSLTADPRRTLTVRAQSSVGAEFSRAEAPVI